jgi:hypothetical protein
MLVLCILCSSIAPLSKDLNEYGEWLKFHRLDYWNTEIQKVSQIQELTWSDYGLEPDYIDLFSPFFIYSKDSAHFIDLDTYSLVLEKDNAGNLTSSGSGVDTKVQLVDTKNMTTTTLLFCGTDCYPETAMWRNNSWLEIYGFKLNEKDKFIPTVWKFELEMMQFVESIHLKKFNNRPKSIAQERRLQKVEFKD